MVALLRTAALAALAAILFGAWIDWRVLDPANVGWVLGGGDWGLNAIGLNAYLHAGNWPSTVTPLLLHPQGTHLLLMDANPLLGLVLKPFAAWLPAGIQLIGPWLFLCVTLHVMFAYALVSRHAPDFATAWLGTALLSMLPTLYARFGHSNLCAHWLILWALWIFADHDRARRPLWWVAVVTVAALVHSYLLIMVVAIWASAMLAALAEAARGRAVGQQMLRLLREMAPVLAAVAVIAALHGVFDQRFLSTGSYGAYSMPVDALVNPGAPGLSALMPSSPDRGLGYEGFQYLGAGLLLLVVAALIALIVAPGAVGPLPLWRRIPWLVPALCLMTVLAVSNVVVFRGTSLIQIPLPAQVIDALDLVRASGRLFWPVAYVIVLAAIVMVLRLKRWVAQELLLVAFIVQAIDLAPVFAAGRYATARAQMPETYARIVDPRWDELIGQASAIEVEPPDPFRQTAVVEEIAWRAVIACRPMRYVPSARLSIEQQERVAADHANVRAGKIDPSRLYILSGPEDVPARLRPELRKLDGVLIIPPSRRGNPLSDCR